MIKDKSDRPKRKQKEERLYQRAKPTKTGKGFLRNVNDPAFPKDWNNMKRDRYYKECSLERNLQIR